MIIIKLIVYAKMLTQSLYKELFTEPPLYCIFIKIKIQNKHAKIKNK